MEKPTYEELAEENKKLKSSLSFLHYHIGKYMKSINLNLLEFITGVNSPYKTERPLIEIDLSHENVDKYIMHHTVQS